MRRVYRDATHILVVKGTLEPTFYGDPRALYFDAAKMRQSFVVEGMPPYRVVAVHSTEPDVRVWFDPVAQKVTAEVQPHVQATSGNLVLSTTSAVMPEFRVFVSKAKE